MGTSDFALPAFEALLGDARGRFDVCAVLSRPDAPTGRGLATAASPIALAARAAGIELLQPPTLRGPGASGLVERLAELDADFNVVASYGMMLTAAVIDVPRFGTINIHASLLPRWRGAAPIQRAILAGDPETGVSIQQVRVELDSGPVYATAATPIADKGYGELAAELAQLGAGLLAECLPQVAAGAISAREQDASQVTYAAKLTAAELALDPLLTTVENLRRVQASNRHTPARAKVGDKGVRVLKARAGEVVAGAAGAVGAGSGAATGAAPGVTGARALRHNQGLLLQTADGWLEALSIAPDGRKEMSGIAFASGLPALRSGQPLDWSKWE